MCPLEGNANIHNNNQSVNKNENNDDTDRMRPDGYISVNDHGKKLHNSTSEEACGGYLTILPRLQLCRRKEKAEQT